MSELLLVLLKGLLAKTLADELGAALQGLARWLVKRSASVLAEDGDRYEEEWLAVLDDRKTSLRKIVFALGIVHAAKVLRRECSKTHVRAKKEPTIRDGEEVSAVDPGSASHLSQEAQHDRLNHGLLISREGMVKGYEFAKDQYVHFSPEEIERLTGTS